MSVVSRDIVIRNALGLHARPAMQFVDLANQFTSEITVEKRAGEGVDEPVTVDGKSVMQMITLEATQGTKLHVTAAGDDAADAVEQLAKLVDDKFGEDE
jgi:phosphotransferase system HPr (HPr) family protein